MVISVHMMERTSAPDFSGGGPWINTLPLAMEDLQGKVVMVDFWTYTCVNCMRTLPHLKDWWAKYRDKGFVMVDVHSPEFEFERDWDNVERICRENGISWPVVLDNEYRIWNAYGNRYWPHRYLIDKDGIIRYDHAGEGAYDETEMMIRRLLEETDPAVELPPTETTGHIHRMGELCFIPTPEIYCGYERGRIGNERGFEPGQVAVYDDPSAYEENKFYLDGTWAAYPDHVRHARATPNPEDHLALVFRGTEANAILGNARGGRIKVFATVDGATIPGSMAGDDLEIRNDQSFVTVTEPKLYRLFRDKEYGMHVLRLVTGSDELDVYAFAFGGCVETKG